jgi:hypothetical protein
MIESTIPRSPAVPPSDIQIARSARLRCITELAHAWLGIAEGEANPRG